MIARWILATCLVCGLVAAGYAAVTPEQKKELIEVNRSMSVVPTHIRKKEYAEAEEFLKAVEAEVAEMAKTAGVETTDKAFATVNKTLVGHRKALDKAQGKVAGREKAQTVSFTKDIAPLINEKCVGCHGPAMQSAGLRLDTFAGWKKGGKSGLLLTVGAPQQSLIALRMTAPEKGGRMPKDGEAIDREKIAVLASWITQGAPFDGESEDASLNKLKTKKEVDEIEASIKIVKATGKEKVSFTRDVAPFMANLCVRCHSGNNPRGGLSLETFYDMMKGGDSGHVVLPGEPKEKSRLFRLTGGLENPRMPNDNQSRITKANYEALKTWFDEGCVYDGVDAKTPLRNFVKSDAEMAMEKASALSPAQFSALRKEKTAELFKKSLPKDAIVTLESDELLIAGNAPEARLKQIEGWSKEQVASLRKAFGAPAGQIWRGRLAVLVMKDRFSYEEFVQTIDGRRPQPGMTGHAVVTATHDDAYIVVEDVGDEVSKTSPGFRVNLIDQLTAAYLKRTGADMPNWLLRGTGLSLASKVVGSNAYLAALPKEASAIVPILGKPQDVFVDSSFSPDTIGAVGMTLVEFMIANGGPGKFGALIKAMETGSSTNEAIEKSYGMDSAAMGARFRDAVKGK